MTRLGSAMADPTFDLLVFGTRILADSSARISTVGKVDHVSSLEEARASLAKSKPDVILLDVERAGVDGLERLRVLREEAPRIPVLAVMEADDPASLSRVMRTGASGVLKRDASQEQIEDALSVVSAGGSYLEILTDNILRATATRADPTILTGREKEVLGLLADGYSARQIATRLALSERTVNTHVASLYRKLAVSNRVEAVRAAIRMGIVSGGE